MKTAAAVFVILGASLLATAGGGDESGYRLVWADEFNTDGNPDSEKWRFEHGHVRNREAQWYQPQNATCSNGVLVIEGRRERVPNTSYKPDSGDWRTKWKFAQYTSASLTTKGLHSWTYGRFEMRARIDLRSGLWPAFWTVGAEGKWPTNGEIDIMEYYQGNLLANLMWGSGKGKRLRKDVSKMPLASLGDAGWAERFHVWRMDWDEEHIRIYVDGRLLNETDLSTTRNPSGSAIENPFRRPHHIILNLAIGGTCGGDPSATRFPARYEIDYVRVYQKGSKKSAGLP